MAKNKDPKKPKPKPKVYAKKSKAKAKIKKVMHEFGAGELRSGSKQGPVVTNPKQAIAIAISESKKKKGK